MQELISYCSSLAHVVADNCAVLRDGAPSSKTLSLPEFLTLLQQQGIAVESHRALVEQCTKLYSLARYEDGVSYLAKCWWCVCCGTGGINQAVIFSWSDKIIIFSLLYQTTPSLTAQKSTFLEGERWGYLIDYICQLLQRMRDGLVWL